MSTRRIVVAALVLAACSDDAPVALPEPLPAGLEVCADAATVGGAPCLDAIEADGGVVTHTTASVSTAECS